MAVPAPKSPFIEEMLDRVATNSFGMSRTDAIKQDICLICKQPATEFSNELSQQEYTLSATCQACQNKLRKELTEDGLQGN